jgi:hypothetical protein
MEDLLEYGRNKTKIRPKTAKNRTKQPKLLSPQDKTSKHSALKPEQNTWVRPKDFDLFKIYSFIYKDQYANNLFTDQTAHITA